MSLPTPFYDEGGITIYCGDCREIVPALGVFGLLLTDPPYPNNEGHFLDGIAAARQIIPFVPCPSKMVFWGELEIPPCDLPLVAKHIWHRTNVNGKIYEPCYEFNADGQKRRSDVIRGAAIFDGAGAGCCEYLGHPTQKPLHVIRKLMGASRTSGAVLDPFMGVGATLLAAKELGRVAVGIEINKDYCEAAVARLSQGVLLPC